MKYLVSLYFDSVTAKQIHTYMEMVADASGNRYMIEHGVPPHITISSFETEHADVICEALSERFRDVKTGELQWVGIGSFMNSVLYLTPVLNEYLQELMEAVYDCIGTAEDVQVSKFYRPYQWLPHTTIGKKMNAEEQLKGFQAIQTSFHEIRGKVVKIGLSVASPHEELTECFLAES